MILHPRTVSSAAAIALTLIASLAAYYYKSRNKEINEVMIFCKLQYNACNYFTKLISFVEDAKYCVNICMPGIHNSAIRGRLLELIKNKNIKVRIIIDRSGYNEYSEVFIKELIDSGAEIRCKINEPMYNMQHKFCLIDDKILMTGTLNWGNDLSSDHWNYVYVTSKNQLVEPIKGEFYKLWDVASDVKSLKVQPVYDSDAETKDFENVEISDGSEDIEVKEFKETRMTPELYIA